MSTLSRSETNDWNHILNTASLKLVKVIIKHSERQALELAETERRLRHSSSLCPTEQEALQDYEEKRLGELGIMKTNKLARDRVESAPVAPLSAVHCGDGQETSGNCGNVLAETQAIVFSAKHNQQADLTRGVGGSDTPEPTANIVNLSSITLSAEQLSLCSKGLSFCPSSGEFNEFQLFKDLDSFARNLRLREYFHDRPQDPQERIPNASDQSWTPGPQRDKYLDLYIELVQRDTIRSCGRQRGFTHNLTQAERASIRTLNSRTDIVIKPADKGGAIVILNKEDYLNEGFKQLNSTDFYKELPNDPTETYTTKITQTLTSLLNNGEISEDMHKAMKPTYPKPGRFYTLPKIHKPGNPGRPIVSGIDTVTERISSFVNFLIMSLPPKAPSYIMDTNHFLREVSKLVLPAGAILVTLDVASLYTNIPHNDGIEAVMKAYKKAPPKINVKSEVLETLMRLVLEHNNFEFEGKHFLQIRGTAMGTKMAPNYANLFMADLESHFLSGRQLLPLFYKRYIDDIFMIWPHGESDLLNFIRDFNVIHPNIKFSHIYSKTNINFLDVMVELNGDTLKTKLYRKPTDRQQYLHFKSSHPKHCKTSIPFSQAHRLRRICSDLNDFDRNADNLKAVLTKQSYPAPIVDRAIERARLLDRETIIHQPRRTVPNNQQTNLVVTYAANLPNLNNILRKHYSILQQSERLHSVFSEPPRVVFRRGRNLRDILVQSKSSASQPSGCQPCQKPRCKVCKHMERVNEVTSTNSEYSFRIKGTLDCDTKNVVYVLRCTICNMDYVGQTGTAFRLRFNNHKAHTLSLPNLPFSRHMNLPNHTFDAVRVILLQAGYSSDRERELREAFFIHKFKALTHGINEHPGKLAWLQQAT